MFSKKRIYLDWAAAATVSRVAKEACARALDSFGNPSSPHAEGRKAHAILEDARTRIAALAGVKADAVIFTSNATEANALAIEGIVHAHLQKGVQPADVHVLYLPSAHSSTIGAVERLRAVGVSTEALTLTNASIDLTALKEQLRPTTLLIALEAVCGETGTRFDVRGVRQVLDTYQKESGTRIYLHADASQLPLAESFLRTRLASDTLSLDAQKVGGVRGVGALIAPRQIPLSPIMSGGGQERGLRPGTEATAPIAAFAAALTEVAALRESFAADSCRKRERLLARILKEIPNAIENGGSSHVSHILNVSLIGRDTDYLVALLDEAGFAVSTRSACDSDEEGSRAVHAYTTDAARAGSTLRVSWGPGVTDRELDRFATSLIHAVRFLDANTL